MAKDLQDDAFLLLLRVCHGGSLTVHHDNLRKADCRKENLSIAGCITKQTMSHTCGTFGASIVKRGF